MGGSKLPCRGLEAPHGALPTGIDDIFDRMTRDAFYQEFRARGGWHLPLAFVGGTATYFLARTLAGA